MKQFALVLLAMVLNGNLFAQDLHSEGDLNRNITPYHEAADEANASSVAYLQKQEAWKNFRNQHPGWGARFNRYTRLPHRAFGDPITFAPGGNDAVQKATLFLQNELSGFQLPLNELVLTRNFNDGKYIHVDFKQVHNNYEILWSRTTVRLTQDLRIMLFGTDIHRNIPNLIPSLTAGAAIQKAEAALTGTITHSAIEGNLKIFPLPVNGSYDYRLVYPVVVETKNPNGTPGRYLSYVDANSGEVLYRQNQVKFFDVKVKGEVFPVNQYTATQNRPMKNMKLTIGANTYYTDNTGKAVVPSGPANATLFLSGKWVEVIDDGGGASSAASYAHTFTTSGDSTTFDVTVPHANERGVNVYYHVNEVHDFMKTKFPTFTVMDNPLPANVDVSGTCNAFYNGSSINFYAAGGGCNAFSYIGDVMSHEYGHGISDKFYTWQSSSFDNGAMGEGYSDTWANCILKTGIIGAGANSPTDYIRRYDLSPKVYPQDIIGEVHADGEIIAGAWWDVGVNWNSIDSMGDLFAASYYGLATGPDGTEGTVYHDILIDALNYDDDNSNLNDGTPHFTYIVQAFATHGIFLLSNTELVHQAPNSIPASTPVPLEADAIADYPAFLGNVKLIYRLKGTTTYDTLTMTKSAAHYSTTFPAAANGAVYEYIFAVYDYTNMLSLYSPSNSAFITGFTQRNIPYYLPVGYNTVMAEPFDNISATTAGWTIGDVAGDNATAGKWIVAVPVSSVTNGDTVQTGHDHSTGSGKCAVTANAASASSQPGNSDVDGGRTSMITETYDLSKYNQPIVSYWRWYTNSQSSNNPGKDMWRVWVSYDNGGSWNMIEKTFKPDVRWRRNVFIPDLTKGTTIKMMFIATDSAATSAGGTWVEAAVDDIEILELGSGATVGLNNPAEQNSSIYPNPANDQLFIQCQQKGVLNYQISNAIGQVMMNGQLLKSQSSASLNTSSLPEGIYFVNIEVNGWKTIHRLVIKR